MPRISLKESVTELVTLVAAHGFLYPEESILADEDTLICLLSLQQFRYCLRRTPVPKCHNWSVSILLSPEFDEKRFRQHLRMDKRSFHELTALIKDHPIFKASQIPTDIQLAVALNVLGTYGNGASYSIIAAKYGISEGSVDNFVQRVITVLNNIANDWIQWPNKEERSKLASTLAQEFLPKCIGFVDGSDAPFYQAPRLNKQCYWSRKKKYCMQFQIVCDIFRQTRHLHTGYPGSVHDARVFSTCQLALKPEEYFSPGEFIIGDSAYASSETVVVPFKRNCGNLNPKKAKFNRHLSSKRVFVEHSIGMLKGRWQSLQSLRINVNESSGHIKACRWIQACVVLHNFLLQKDYWNKLEDFIYSEPEQLLDNEESTMNNVSEHKRNALCRMFNAMI